MCHLKKHGLMEKATVFFELLLHFFAFACNAKRFAIANVFFSAFAWNTKSFAIAILFFPPPPPVLLLPSAVF